MHSTTSSAVQALVGRLKASEELEAGSFATELGHLFAERPLDSNQARELRLEVLKAAKRRNAVQAATLAAFASFLVAYEASRQSLENEADAAADLNEADWGYLRQLSQQPATPSELAGGKDNGKVSRRLDVLEERGLVVIVDGRDARTRPRELTSLGQLVVARSAKQDSTAAGATQAAPPATADTFDTPLSTWLERGVESTLRALKSILASSDRPPMQRSEVEASFAPELRKHGFLQTFEYHVEAFGLADIDDWGRCWPTNSNEHTERWTVLMSQLRDVQLCQRVFRPSPDERYCLLTVSERQEQWRQVLQGLTQRIEVYTEESWKYLGADEDAVPRSLIVDDSTLASKLARSSKLRLFTLEAKVGEQEPLLRRLHPSSIPASA